MHHKRHSALVLGLLALALVIVFAADLATGSVAIPLDDLAKIRPAFGGATPFVSTAPWEVPGGAPHTIPEGSHRPAPAVVADGACHHPTSEEEYRELVRP